MTRAHPMTNLMTTGSRNSSQVSQRPRQARRQGCEEFSILGTVAKAMDEAGVPQSEVDAFMCAAMAHGEDHLLRTVMNWVMVR
jgi:hypothetical protein